MKARKIITLGSLLISLLLIQCNGIGSKKDFPKNSQESSEIKSESTDTIKEPIWPVNKKEPERIDYEAVYKSLVSEFEPEITSEEEFDNFKKKSNYIKVIEAYDSKNSIEYFGGKENEENIRYYALPTEINTKEYSSNSILFGDLNEDGKRDCIIIAYRSDMYNEVAFLYVFINKGTTFKLEDVTNEAAICGCKEGGWPSRFRLQKIEDGFLEGVSECHYQDAHCCPSLYFRTKVEFSKGKLQFHSAEFVMDDAIQYRPTPTLDSILVGRE
jgi:hypothetical protein